MRPLSDRDTDGSAQDRASPPSAELTVIIPTLNAAATIGAALNSIVTAASGVGTDRLEVLLVDGGSADNTTRLAAEWLGKLPGLRIIEQMSEGLAAARNEGIAAASSGIIGFCDSDDAWTSDAITVRLDGLNRHASAWAATGQVHFVSVEGANTGAPARRVAGSTHPGYTPGAMLIRKEAFQSVGKFDETLRVGADSDWILRAEQAMGPPLMVTQTVLEKGLRNGSLSTDIASYRAELTVIARRFIARAEQGSNK